MLKIKAIKATIFSEALSESKEKILFIKEDETFVAPLFFKMETSDESIERVLKTEEINAVDENELVEKVVEFYKENMNDTFESTESTMKHWQYMNSFTNQMYAGREVL